MSEITLALNSNHAFFTASGFPQNVICGCKTRTATGDPLTKQRE